MLTRDRWKRQFQRLADDIKSLPGCGLRRDRSGDSMSLQADLHVNDTGRIRWWAAGHAHALAVSWPSFGCSSLLVSRSPPS